MHLELLTVAATAAATAGTAATALAGDSLTIKNANRSKSVDILAMWQTNQTAGFSQLVYPSAHDTSRGYRAAAAIGVNTGVLPFGMKLRLNPQEVLAPTIGATAVAGDVENLAMLIRYEDMPGINARMITPSQLWQRTEKLTTIDQSLASTAGPSYGTEELINADAGSDLLLANRDYAVMGMASRTTVHSINLRGPDLGNVRIACPGVLRQELTSQWFVALAKMHSEPLIPVINSGNRAATFMGVCTDENAGTFVCTLYLALLR
jgi:hypothetical protein